MREKEAKMAEKKAAKEKADAEKPQKEKKVKVEEELDPTKYTDNRRNWL